MFMMQKLILTASIILLLKIISSTSYTYIDGPHFTQRTGSSQNPFYGKDPPVNEGSWRETRPKCFDLDGDHDLDCVVGDSVTSLP